MQSVGDPRFEGGNQGPYVRENCRKFKFVDGIERFQAMPLHFPMDIRNACAEPVFLPPSLILLPYFRMTEPSF